MWNVWLSRVIEGTTLKVNLFCLSVCKNQYKFQNTFFLLVADKARLIFTYCYWHVKKDYSEAHILFQCKFFFAVHSNSLHETKIETHCGYPDLQIFKKKSYVGQCTSMCYVTIQFYRSLWDFSDYMWVDFEKKNCHTILVQKTFWDSIWILKDFPWTFDVSPSKIPWNH